MTTERFQATANARTRSAPGLLTLTGMLSPALGVVVVLFGGGLVLGLLQSLGYLPAAGMDFYTLKHFRNVVLDPWTDALRVDNINGACRCIQCYDRHVHGIV